MLLDILLADLQRQYSFDGRPQKKPSVLGLLAHALSPRFIPVILCRTAHALYQRRVTPLARVFSLINFVLFGIEIGIRCEIGQGLYFPHTVGTVIGAARIGRNAVIYQGVTLGAKEVDMSYNPNQRPWVGDNVVIGSGAKLLGRIQIGNNVTIGANAVVLDSFPDNVAIGGIPATVLYHREDVSA